MSINIGIRTESKKYGFITDNDRVHNVGQETLLNSSYGALVEGEKGLGNHTNLANIFNHTNSIINKKIDRSVAFKFLSGRDDLSGKHLEDEIRDATEVIESKIAARKEFLEAQGTPEDNDRVLNELSADFTAVNKIRVAIDPDTAALRHSSEFEFNPDFTNTNIKFDYSQGLHNESRANDLYTKNSLTPGVRTPNIGFPLLNSEFTNNEAVATKSTDIQGLDGGGGFGSSQKSNFLPATQITQTLDRYTGESVI